MNPRLREDDKGEESGNKNCSYLKALEEYEAFNKTQEIESDFDKFSKLVLNRS